MPVKFNIKDADKWYDLAVVDKIHVFDGENGLLSIVMKKEPFTHYNMRVIMRGIKARLIEVRDVIGKDEILFLTNIPFKVWDDFIKNGESNEYGYMGYVWGDIELSDDEAEAEAEDDDPSSDEPTN